MCKFNHLKLNTFGRHRDQTGDSCELQRHPSDVKKWINVELLQIYLRYKLKLSFVSLELGKACFKGGYLLMNECNMSKCLKGEV